MRQTLRTFRKDKYILETFYDEYCENPREWSDRSTKMILFHWRYDLGDKHDYNYGDYSSWDEMREDIIAKEQSGMIRPVYMYEHGLVSLSTRTFNDRFDSAQVGYISVSTETFQQLGIDQCLDLIEKDLSIYAKYINGEVFMCTISEEQVCNLGCTHKTLVDTIGGYYCEEECFAEGVSQIDYYIKEDWGQTV